jgi:hypothetical protein
MPLTLLCEVLKPPFAAPASSLPAPAGPPSGRPSVLHDRTLAMQAALVTRIIFAMVNQWAKAAALLRKAKQDVADMAAKTHLS